MQNVLIFLLDKEYINQNYSIVKIRIAVTITLHQSYEEDIKIIHYISISAIEVEKQTK